MSFSFKLEVFFGAGGNVVVMVYGGVYALFHLVNTAGPLVPALVKGIHLFGFGKHLKFN